MMGKMISPTLTVEHDSSMDSSIIILDSDDDINDSEISSYKSSAPKTTNPLPGHIVDNDDFLEFANITVPNDQEDTFIREMGLEMFCNQKDRHQCVSTENILAGSESLTDGVICLDDEENDQEKTNLSNIENYPSSPKQNNSIIFENDSDEDIVVTRIKNSGFNGEPVTIHSDLLSTDISNNHVEPTHIAELKSLANDWRNGQHSKVDNTDKTRLETLFDLSSSDSTYRPCTKPPQFNELKTCKSKNEALNLPSKNIWGLPKRHIQVNSTTKATIGKLNDSFSDISDFSSSLNDVDIRHTHTKNLSRQNMQRKETGKINNMESICDLQRKGTSNPSVTQSRMHLPRLARDTSISDISNISFEISQPTKKKKKVNINNSYETYTDGQLEIMLDRARKEDPQSLRKVNQSNIGKDELTARITCCFSSCLNESLKIINETYPSHIKNAKFEVFNDPVIPMIKFKRYANAIYYKKKSTMIPCKPKQITEDFVILVYDAENLLDIFDQNIMQQHLKTIKKKNSKTNFAVWILKYDQYLQKLRTNANRLHKKQVMQNLETEEESSKKRRRKASSDEQLIYPSDVVRQMLKYEVKYNFSFQQLKGLSDLIDWLMVIAYTLSSRHMDNIQRNDEFMNLGKVKSGNDAKECLAVMMAQLKGVTDQRANSFVKTTGYSSIGEVFEDVLDGVDFTSRKLLRTDHIKLLEKLMKATDGDQPIS